MRPPFFSMPQPKGMPQGTLPVLEIDGTKKISSSEVIARHLAREFDLYGKGIECTMCDDIFDTLLDVFGLFETIAFLKGEDEKKCLYANGVDPEHTLVSSPFNLGYALEANVKFRSTAKKMKDFYETTAPKFLGFLEAFVKEGGKGGFAVGSSLTLADLALHVYLENIRVLDKLEKFHLLAANRKEVATQPRI